jgi:hypothetical protein
MPSMIFGVLIDGCGFKLLVPGGGLNIFDANAGIITPSDCGMPEPMAGCSPKFSGVVQ